MESSQSLDPGDARTIGASARSAIIWSAAGTAFRQFALVGIFILLADRLDPKVYGIFALATVFVEVFWIHGVATFIDVILRRQDFSQRTLSTVFWLSAGVLAVVAAILSAAAFPLAHWFKEPGFVPVLVAMAVMLIPAAFIVGPAAVLRNKMDFRTGATIEMVASSLAGMAAVGVTFTEYAQWALVVQAGGRVLVLTILLRLATRLWPTFEFDFGLSKQLFKSFVQIFSAQGLAVTIPQIAILSIGSIHGAIIIGQMRVAMRLLEVLNSVVVSPVGSLWLVLVSSARANDARRKDIFLQLSGISALVCLPAFLGVALVANQIAGLLFNEKYESVGEILMILAAMGMFLPIANPQNALLISVQKMKWLFALLGTELVVILIAMAATQNLSWKWMLIASASQYLIAVTWGLAIALRIMATPAKDYFAMLLPPYLAAAVMTLVVLGVGALANQMDLYSDLGRRLEAAALLGLKGAAGAVAYASVLLLFFRRWTFSVYTSLKSGKAA